MVALCGIAALGAAAFTASRPFGPILEGNPLLCDYEGLLGVADASLLLVEFVPTIIVRNLGVARVLQSRDTREVEDPMILTDRVQPRILGRVLEGDGIGTEEPALDGGFDLGVSQWTTADDTGEFRFSKHLP
jgi:hypothetical protein